MHMKKVHGYKWGNQGIKWLQQVNSSINVFGTEVNNSNADNCQYNNIKH